MMNSSTVLLYLLTTEVNVFLRVRYMGRCLPTAERNVAVGDLQDEIDRLSNTARKATEQVMELQQDLEASVVAAAAMEDYSKQADTLREELSRAKAKASAEQGYAAQAAELAVELSQANLKVFAGEKHALEVEELRQELDLMSNTAESAAREAAAEALQLRNELEMAVAAAASTAQEAAAGAVELQEELNQANATTAAAASALQESALEMEELKEELEMANTAASAAQEYAEEARELRLELEKAKTEAKAEMSAAGDNAARGEALLEGLDRAEAAAASARQDAANWNEACLAAEAAAARADKARADAEAMLDALRQSLAGKEADMEELGMRAAQTDGTLVAAEDAAQTAMQALKEAREDVFRAEERSTAAEQARDLSVQEASRLSEAVGGLQARLAEATAYVKEIEGLNEEQRGGLQSSNKREGELERSLLATRVELDGKRAPNALLQVLGFWPLALDSCVACVCGRSAD